MAKSSGRHLRLREARGRLRLEEGVAGSPGKAVAFGYFWMYPFRISGVTQKCFVCKGFRLFGRVVDFVSLQNEATSFNMSSL